MVEKTGFTSSDEAANGGLADGIRYVKRLLRAAMSGPVSASMRAQGHSYKLNFGVDQPRLLTIADEIRNDVVASSLDSASASSDASSSEAAEPETSASGISAAALASALWKEDVRECRLLACMLMPTSDFPEDLAEVWVEQLRFAEEAQALAMHLLPRVPYASDLAFRLVSRERVLDRLTGWLLFGRLFAQGKSLSQRDADEVLDHLAAELADTTASMQLRQTALNALNRFCDLGEAEAARGERILGQLWQ